MKPLLSVIVPTLNEGALIESLLVALQPLREAGCEVIVSDGGSTDGTAHKAQLLCDRVVQGEAGRAAQMNRGAAFASGSWLWFLHADTRLESEVQVLMPGFRNCDGDWGFFHVGLDAAGWRFRVIEWLMNRRSRFSGIGTGDQGLFVRAALFEQLGGFAQIPLMEDVELCKRLRRKSSPEVMKSVLRTSARRWQQHGVMRTVLLMWRLRFSYWLGVAPERLARHYRVCNSPTRGS